MRGTPHTNAAVAQQARRREFPCAIALLEKAELTHDESARAEAREIFARLGARPWLERADRLVAEHEAPVAS